jgi:hypothetical protein
MPNGTRLSHYARSTQARPTTWAAARLHRPHSAITGGTPGAKKPRQEFEAPAGAKFGNRVCFLPGVAEVLSAKERQWNRHLQET